MENDNFDPLGHTRRSLLVGSGVAITALGSTQAMAAVAANRQPPVAEPVADPVPPEGRTAGPILPNRGSSLARKVAVVTGAARGIGRAIAIEFAANGADVVALDIAGPVSPTADAIPATEDELKETVAQIQHYGRRATAVKADIRDIVTLRRIADQVEHEHGKIDIVVANAAIQGWKPLMEMDDMDWRDQIENNLNGTANTVRAFGPKLVARNRGRLILLSSMQGREGTKGGASYSASKWGILGLMKSAALELGQYNVTVTPSFPGWSGQRSLTTSSVSGPRLPSRTGPPRRILRHRKLGLHVRRQCPFRLVGFSQKISRRWRFF
jgi:NAD(P)-dependent dehydrogenase (short-subunit alcohol dehydrogenase family)